MDNVTQQESRPAEKLTNSDQVKGMVTINGKVAK